MLHAVVLTSRATANDGIETVVCACRSNSLPYLSPWVECNCAAIIIIRTVFGTETRLNQHDNDAYSVVDAGMVIFSARIYRFVVIKAGKVSNARKMTSYR